MKINNTRDASARRLPMSMTPHPVSPRFGRILLASLALFAAVLLSGTTAAQAATKAWTGLVDNNWHEPGNWSPPGVPAGNDTININLAGTSVNATPPVTIANGGTLNWTSSGGSISGGGLTIASGGVLNVADLVGFYCG